MNTRVVAKVLVVNPEGQLLLLRRSDTDERRPLQWDIPGGHTDGNEFANEAAARETKEEAGIDVDPRQLRLAYVTCQVVESGLNVVWLFFIGQAGHDGVTISHEHSEHRWVTIDKAIGLIEYDRQRVMLEYVRDNGLLA